jgi:hypothetical protein
LKVKLPGAVSNTTPSIWGVMTTLPCGPSTRQRALGMPANERESK